ncbi:hypothetical protein AB205_0173600 [Aquarana catesbeiana]|uniref:Uncharacterized protein n=1 Tax=Aquarana catesbeiana TaxID=8400 RepID=A0A2G9QJM8_AQUCT|nr:hypothetical protein AB205_0173600 [Aquarana catesbeiana]PIO15313.1 hypothetical protein AB205_0173600 [Aquarana catesbeiana]
MKHINLFPIYIFGAKKRNHRVASYYFNFAYFSGWFAPPATAPNWTQHIVEYGGVACPKVLSCTKSLKMCFHTLYKYPCFVYYYFTQQFEYLQQF